MSDPAKTPLRTPAETLAQIQDGCRREACAVVKAGRIKCPFCPWLKKYYNP